MARCCCRSCLSTARASGADPRRARMADRRLHPRHARKRHRSQGHPLHRARPAAAGGRHRRTGTEPDPQGPGCQDPVERPVYQAGARGPEPARRGAPGVRPEGRNQAAGVHAGAGGHLQPPSDLRPVPDQGRRPDRGDDRKGEWSRPDAPSGAELPLHAPDTAVATAPAAAMRPSRPPCRLHCRPRCHQLCRPSPRRRWWPCSPTSSRNRPSQNRATWSG
ncbi:hypothetical protein LP420_26560 [Massilia sp. B-10]|nr:hypothetical protein LP420_26560 [Massilia sp. B-10]